MAQAPQRLQIRTKRRQAARQTQALAARIWIGEEDARSQIRPRSWLEDFLEKRDAECDWENLAKIVFSDMRKRGATPGCFESYLHVTGEISLPDTDERDRTRIPKRAALWQKIATGVTGDLKKEGVAYAPGLGALVEEIWRTRERTEALREDIGRFGRSYLGRNTCPPSARLGEELPDPGGGIAEAIARLEKWLETATDAQAIARLFRQGPGLQYLFLRNTRLAADPANLHLLQRANIEAGLLALLDNPHATKETIETLVMAGLAAGDKPPPVGGIPGITSLFDECARRGITFSDKATGWMEQKVLEVSDRDAPGLLATVAHNRDLCQVPRIREILLGAAPHHSRHMPLLANSQGREWAKLVARTARATPAHITREFIRTLNATGEWNLQSVERGDLLVLLQSPVSEIRDAGMRLAGQIRGHRNAEAARAGRKTSMV